MANDLCECGHEFALHGADKTEARVDDALQIRPRSGDIYSDEPRGKDKCNAMDCDCLKWRPGIPSR